MIESKTTKYIWNVIFYGKTSSCGTTFKSFSTALKFISKNKTTSDRKIVIERSDA